MGHPYLLHPVQTSPVYFLNYFLVSHSVMPLLCSFYSNPLHAYQVSFSRSDLIILQAPQKSKLSLFLLSMEKK